MSTPSKIHSRTNVRIISDPNPNERGHTGNCLIAEKEGKYGLLTAWEQDYLEVLPFNHTTIKHFELATDGNEKWKHSFKLCHESNKIGFYFASSVFSGYIFDDIYINEDLDTIIGIEQDGKFGYCEVTEIMEDKWPSMVYFKKDYQLKMETLSRFHFKKIQVQRKDGKWALFNRTLEPKTKFIFNEPLRVSSSGRIIVAGSKFDSREELSFRQFFSRYGI